MSESQVSVNTSKYYNLWVLRRLFNPGHVGRGLEGAATIGQNRYDMHPTVTRKTHLAYSQTVPVGKGKYGSPVVELALRLVLSCLGVISIDVVSQEFAKSIIDRHSFADNLRKLAGLIDNPAGLYAELPSEEKEIESA